MPTIKSPASYVVRFLYFAPVKKRPNVENIEFEETREAWGWAECTHAKVEEIMVQGTHVTMMALPHVKYLG